VLAKPTLGVLLVAGALVGSGIAYVVTRPEARRDGE
jgi:hypothetical protein